jgi:hypothetical protein
MNGLLRRARKTLPESIKIFTVEEGLMARSCGWIFSERLNKKIEVFAKEGESCGDARERVLNDHKTGQTTDDNRSQSGS